MLMAAAVVALVAADASSARTTTTSCTTDDAPSSNRARFYCDLTLRRNESATLPLSAGCDRLRNFGMGATSENLAASEFRRTPMPRFRFRGTALWLGEGADEREDIPYRVDVFVNRKRVKVVNYAPFQIDFEFSMRCPV